MNASPVNTLPQRIGDRSDYFFPGATYRHYSGQTYTALHRAFIHDTREPVVVYVAHDTQEISVRTVYEFFQDVQIEGGAIVPRFSRVPAEPR